MSFYGADILYRFATSAPVDIVQKDTVCSVYIYISLVFALLSNDYSEHEFLQITYNSVVCSSPAD